MVLACDSPDTFSGKIPEVSHLPTDASWIFPFKTHAVQCELKAGSLGLSYEALSPHFHHTLLLNQFLSFLLCLPCRYLEILETGTIWNFIILILEERKKKEKERKKKEHDLYLSAHKWVDTEGAAGKPGSSVPECVLLVLILSVVLKHGKQSDNCASSWL